VLTTPHSDQTSLNHDVVVLAAPGIADENLLQLSGGVGAAPSAVGDCEYASGAIVPWGRWRRPSVEERSILAAQTCPRGDGACVSVVRIPARYLALFQSLRDAAGKFRTKAELCQLTTSPSCEAGKNAVVDYVRRTFQPRDRAAAPDKIVAGIRVNSAGLPTVTMHPQTGLLVGLHVDNWYRLPIERRHESPNRICVNIGCQDRFFLFTNMTMDGMCRALKVSPLERLRGATFIGQTFLRLFPSYPVLKLRIRPGEAYIAPTENIVHDASSSEMSEPDVMLSVLGRFATAIE
jgi:hypothetical protein